MNDPFVKRKWNEYEEKKLLMYRDMGLSTYEIGKILDRSSSSIATKGASLGINFPLYGGKKRKTDVSST